MKDKVEHAPDEYSGSLHPLSVDSAYDPYHIPYAASLSSASSASSSASSTSGSTSESLRASFLHSTASQVTDSGSDHHHQYQQQHNPSLSVHPNTNHSPITPQLSTPSQASPSSSPASSTFDGYATIPARFTTLSVNPSNVNRQDPRIHYPNPSVPTTPVVNNFRHSVISGSNIGPTFGDQTFNKLGTNYNLTRVNDASNGSHGSAVGAGMRGVSSLGEATSTPGSRRSPHYASSPHLFVFQAQDDSDDEDTNKQITMSNTLRNRNPNGPQDRSAAIVANTARTLPRGRPTLTAAHSTASAQQQKEPIYSSTADIKKDASRREEEAARHISDSYEVPRCLATSRRSSSCGMITQDQFSVTNQVVARIETSFRGHKTQMWVCRTMANLYVAEGTGENAVWNLKFTGVPALLLDLGDTKSRDKRRLQIVLAEKESGFELWKDVVDNLTSYKVVEPHFHTLYLSSDHRKKIGLSFNEGPEAMTFHKQLETLTSNPENISLSAPGKKKSKSKEKVPKYKAPRKTDISKPCNFHHVTTVDPEDRTHLYTLQKYSSTNSSKAIASEPHSIVTNPIPSPSSALIT